MCFWCTERPKVFIVGCDDIYILQYYNIQYIHTSKDCIVKMILFGYNLFLLLHSMFD